MTAALQEPPLEKCSPGAQTTDLTQNGILYGLISLNLQSRGSAYSLLQISTLFWGLGLDPVASYAAFYSPILYTWRFL